jgi:hypothetical protein
LLGNERRAIYNAYLVGGESMEEGYPFPVYK